MEVVPYVGVDFVVMAPYLGADLAEVVPYVGAVPTEEVDPLVETVQVVMVVPCVVADQTGVDPYVEAVQKEVDPYEGVDQSVVMVLSVTSMVGVAATLEADLTVFPMVEVKKAFVAGVAVLDVNLIKVVVGKLG